MAVRQQDGFRTMGDDDVPQVVEIDRAACRFPWSAGIYRDCIRAGYHCWLYQTEARVVVFAILSVAAGEAHVLNLCVRPDKQGKGYGRMMLRQLLEQAAQAGATTIFLEVRASNEVALNLYKTEGFEQLGRRTGYYPAGENREDAIVLAKKLSTKTQ